MADATKVIDESKNKEPKPEVVMTPEDLQDTKHAVIATLWGSDSADRVVPKEAAKEVVATKEEKKDEKADDKPGGEKKESPDGKDQKGAAEAGKDEKVRSEPRKVIIKKKGGKKGEEAKQSSVQVADVEETVRRVLEESGQGIKGDLPTSSERGSGGQSDLPQLSSQDREIISVLRKMEEKDANSKGLVHQTLDFWKREEAMQTQWEKDHPGEDFDPDADEHKKWYGRHEPRYSADQFEDTKREMNEERLISRARDEIRKEYEPELRRIKVKELEQEVEPLAEEAANNATMNLLASVPEFAALMDDGKGNHVLSEEVAGKLMDSNPALFDIANEESNRLAATVKALEKHIRMGDAFPVDTSYKVTVDGKTVRPFAEITDVFNSLQEACIAAPREKTTFEGRNFVTTADKRARQDQIMRSALTQDAKRRQLNALESSTWTIQPADVLDRLQKVSESHVKAYAEKTKKWFSSRKNGEEKNGERSPGSETDKKPEKTAPPPSGATASSSDVQDNGKKIADKATSQAEEVVKILW